MSSSTLFNGRWWRVLTASGRHWVWILSALFLGLVSGCGNKGVLTGTPDSAMATVPVSSSRSGTSTSISGPTATPFPTWTPTPMPSPTLVPTPTPTWTPTLTPSPTPLAPRPVIAFVSDVSGNDDVYLFDPETGKALNLTHDPAEDRDPTFAPDGQSVVFRSNTGGHWAFYQVDLTTGQRTAMAAEGMAPDPYKGHLAWSSVDGYQYAYDSYLDGNLNLYICDREGVHSGLTQNPAGDYGPAWRPGAPQVAFASWREKQKDIYLLDADGENLTRLTSEPTDEEEPTWHPDGQRLVFVRWVDYDADLYELDLRSGEVSRLTADPYPDRSPVYAPDGTLFWTRYVPGPAFELHDPYRSGRWQLWMRGADGQERQVPLPSAAMDIYTPAAGMVVWPKQGIPDLQVPTPTPTPVAEADLTLLDIDCAGGNPRMNSSIVESYQAWRAEVLAQSGYDVLGTISDMFRGLGYSKVNYGTLSWHRTGRAADLLFEWYDPAEPRHDRFRVVRDDLGPQTYWRLYILTKEQDGSMGEPITVAPWIAWFNLNRDKEPEAYAQGGKPGQIPPGYYVDVTRLAKRHGWHRIASYEEEDFDWKWDSVGQEFWHYQRADGLTWWQAMDQIYSAERLEAQYGWTISLEKLNMGPDWLLAKGVPTPTPGQ